MAESEEQALRRAYGGPGAAAEMVNASAANPPVPRERPAPPRDGGRPPELRRREELPAWPPAHGAGYSPRCAPGQDG